MDINTTEERKQADRLPDWFDGVVGEFGLQMIEPKEINGRKLSGYAIGSAELGILTYRPLSCLLAMTAAEVREWCGGLVPSAGTDETEDFGGFWTAEYESRQPVRSLTSGRYKREDR